jgi:hypothetical protein
MYWLQSMHCTAFMLGLLLACANKPAAMLSLRVRFSRYGAHADTRRTGPGEELNVNTSKRLKEL